MRGHQQQRRAGVSARCVGLERAVMFFCDGEKRKPTLRWMASTWVLRFQECRFVCVESGTKNHRNNHTDAGAKLLQERQQRRQVRWVGNVIA